MAQHQKLQTDDGTPLTAKEGVVIDQQGNEINARTQNRRGHHAYQDPFTGRKIFVWKSGNFLAPILLAPILLALIAVGLTVFAGVAAAAFIVWIFYGLIRWATRL